MPRFGQRSLKQLSTCHSDLQKLFSEVVKHFDCTVIEGHRPKERQNKLFEQGATKVKFPNSMHNTKPSLAADVAFWPIDWPNREKHIHFAGYVMGIAETLGIKIRWGGDWNRNQDSSDEDFSDLVHFEIDE